MWNKPFWNTPFPKTGWCWSRASWAAASQRCWPAILREIIEKGGRNVAIYESPIEFDYDTIQGRGGPVSQSSIPDHLGDFLTATRNSTRTAPDVVLIGESRDRETLRGMMESAEVGVAAYSTVHSRSVPKPSRAFSMFSLVMNSRRLRRP
ncbi:MAG: Flp pilus assembly complex ATPase component TadA [Desulfovibrio sp.]|jgi:defect-in-organelle-trafficking protein DotB|nr:Flp pilus assembly complex ATPase component TadA [Desulfovibrio sp.]